MKQQPCLSFDALVQDALHSDPQQYALAQAERGIAIETIHAVCERLGFIGKAELGRTIFSAESFRGHAVIPDSRQLADGSFMSNDCPAARIRQSEHDRLMLLLPPTFIRH